MKFSLIGNASFGMAVSLIFSLETAQAQLTGLGGLTQGAGGIGGATGATGGATGFGAAGGAATNTKLPGSFGGPGTTGVSIYQKDLTSLNPSTAFSNGSAVSGGATGGLGGQTGSTASPFGTNAFSAGTPGGLGATGGFGAGGLGAGGLGGGFGGGRLGGLGGIGGLGGLGGGGAGNNSAQAKKMIRPIVKVDIEVERPSSVGRATDAKVRLDRIPLPKKLQGVTSSVVGDVVVLRGQVATESDKRLVERLVKLEPGIDSVQNEVTVQNSSLERIQAGPNR